MRSLNEILEDISTLSDEIASIDIPNGEARNLIAQLNRIYEDIEKYNEKQKVNTMQKITNDERWFNMQIKDFFVNLYPEIHSIAIGDFNKALEWIIDYRLVNNDEEPVAYEYLAGEYLAQLYLESYKNGRKIKNIDICGIVLRKALQKFENDIFNDEYCSAEVFEKFRNAMINDEYFGIYVESNGVASKFVGFDSELLKEHIEMMVKENKKEWLNNISQTTKTILLQHFDINIDLFLQDNANKSNIVKKYR